MAAFPGTDLREISPNKEERLQGHGDHFQCTPVTNPRTWFVTMYPYNQSKDLVCYTVSL